jgi:predicted site-specific integrase-resolvase
MSAKDKLINLETTAEMLGVSKETLRNWDKSGKLIPSRTEGNHRRYRLGDILDILGVEDEEIKRKDAVCVYCRVSSHEQKQKGDLDRQKGRVLEYCVKKGYNVEHILDEVGSGMSDSRSKLKILFQLVRERKITRVIVEHKDRLTRFMYQIFVEFFNSYQVEIECVETKLNKSFQDELVEDMLALMSSFSAKIYGKRSAENRKKKKLEKGETK